MPQILLDDNPYKIANPLGAYKFKHIVCPLCRGCGQFHFTMGTQEWSEPCRHCNGKKTVVTQEREL